MKNKNTTALLVACATLLASAAAFAQAPSPLENARAALAQNDLAAAEALLTPLVTGEKPDAAACHQLGLLRLRQGRAKDAIELLERATKLDATHADTFAALGMAVGTRMSQVSFMQQAMLSMKLKKAFAKAVELDPHNVSGLIGLARFYTNAPEIAGGSIEKARDYAARVKQIVPFLGELEYGNIAEHHEDYATALTHYEAAALAAPKNVDPHLAAARVLAKLDRPEDARQHLAAALEIAPAHPAAQTALAALPPPRG